MLPSLHALLDRMVETNKAVEDLAQQILPAVRGVIKRYLTHILPRERTAVLSKAATRTLRRSSLAGSGSEKKVVSQDVQGQRGGKRLQSKSGAGTLLPETGSGGKGRGASWKRKMNMSSLIMDPDGPFGTSGEDEEVEEGLGLNAERLTELIGEFPPEPLPCLRRCPAFAALVY